MSIDRWLESLAGLPIGDLHFLRPLWLLALLPVIALYMLWRRRRQDTARWQRSIDPALLEVLLEDTSRSGRGGKRPETGTHLARVMALLLAFLVCGLAGPTLERLPQPVEQKSDALVIALDLSLSMYTRDVDPSRLVRSRQKIVDILRDRKEGYTALVAWAGTAHVVVPLTDDTVTIENLLESLEPAMMPVPGSRPGAALETIHELFENAYLSQGRILFVTDGFDDLGDVTEWRNVAFPISVLGVGTAAGGPIPLDFVEQPGRFLTTQEGEIITARLDESRLGEAAALTFGRYATLQLGDEDISTVLGTTLPGEDTNDDIEREFDLWHDLGYWLAIIALPLLLSVFRRGALASVLVIGMPLDVHASWWDDLWLRDDQQAYEALRSGEPERAATLTERPEWRSVAEYRAGNYASAIATLDGRDGVRDTYNRGNALAKSGDLDGAIAAYDSVLARDPGHEDAAFNKALIEKQKQAQDNAEQEDNNEQQQDSENQSESPRQGDSSSSPSEDSSQPQESQPDKNPAGEEQPGDTERGESGEPRDEEKSKDAQTRQEQADALEQWLRRVPDDPGGLMRRKFQYENDRRLREGDYRYRRGDKIW